MKIFLGELRKILRPLPVFILAAFTALYAYVFIGEQYSYINTAHMTSDYMKLAAELSELTGRPVTEKSLTNAISAVREKHQSLLTESIKNDLVCAEAGVTDYASYIALMGKVVYSRVDEETRQRLIEGTAEIPDAGVPFDPQMNYTLTKAEYSFAHANFTESPIGIEREILRFLDNVIVKGYENYEETQPVILELKKWSTLPYPAAERIIDVHQSGTMLNILPSIGFFETSARLFLSLAILILITVCILFAPVITRDNMTRMRSLMCSSKTGRKTLLIQLCAMITAGVALAVLEIAVTFATFIAGVWGSFLNHGLHSLYGTYSTFTYFWFGGTFGQWILCAAGLIVTVTIAAVCFVFTLSKLSKNYMALLLGLVPVLAALIAIYVKVFALPFGIAGGEITNSPFPLYHTLPTPFVEAYVCGALLLIGVIMAGFMLVKQKRTDIL